jgi:hypothetical protein
MLLASQLTQSAAVGEPYEELAISLHLHHVSLVQWTTGLLPIMRDPGSIPRRYLCETGILLLALSRYSTFKPNLEHPLHRQDTQIPFPLLFNMYINLPCIK